MTDDETSQKIVEIHSDGACSGNPGPGGWGAVMVYGDTVKEIYGSEKETTNNRMEITGALEALKLLTRPCTVHLYTDSTYLRDGITTWIHNWKKNNWKTAAKQPVKNKELWQQLEESLKIHDVKWHWVKAHNGDVRNEQADSLAVKGRDEAKRL